MLNSLTCRCKRFIKNPLLATLPGDCGAVLTVDTEPPKERKGIKRGFFELIFSIYVKTRSARSKKRVVQLVQYSNVVNCYRARQMEAKATAKNHAS